MRTKTHILDRSEKALLRLPKEGQLMVEHEHLFLEVWIDIRDQLTSIKCGLQALNNHLLKLPQNPGKPERRENKDENKRSNTRAD